MANENIEAKLDRILEGIENLRIAMAKREGEIAQLQAHQARFDRHLDEANDFRSKMIIVRADLDRLLRENEDRKEREDELDKERREAKRMTWLNAVGWIVAIATALFAVFHR